LIIKIKTLDLISE